MGHGSRRKFVISSILVAGCVLSLDILLAACGAAGNPSTTTATKSAIQVGAYVPLTGVTAATGVPLANAYRLGIDQINARGGINGHPLVLTLKDDQGTPQNSTTVAAQLGADPAVVVALGTYGSNLVLPSTAALEKAKLPNIQSLSSDSTTSARGFTNLFNLYGPTPTIVDPLVAYIKTGAIKPNRVAFLYLNGPAGIESSTTFKTRLASLGMTTVADEKVQSGAASYASTITRIKAANPDFLFTHFGPSTDLHTVLQNMSDQQFAPKYWFSFGSTAADPVLAQSSGPLLLGIMNGAHWFPGAPFTGNAAFESAYKARYGVAPQLSAASGYQSVQVLEAGLKLVKGDNYTRDTIREALTKVSVETIQGPVKFDAQNLSASLAYIAQIQSKGLITLYQGSDRKVFGSPIGYLGQKLK